MANFQTAAWYSTHPPTRSTRSNKSMFAKLDIKTVMQGLGLANEVALRSLTKEVVEAHNTKNMIPHPKIPDSFLIRSPTNRQESAMAVGRIIGEDSINSTPRWQHFPHQEWLIEALLAIAKTGFGHQRKRKKYLEKQLKENPKEKRGFRPRPYSGYCLTSLSPETNPQPAPQLAPTQAQTPFMTSHVPTTTLVAAPFPLVNSAFSTSSYPLESPRPDPPPRSPPSPTQSQLLSTTSQPPTSNATPLLIPTSISNLGRMILVVRRANISKSWTEPISFFLTEEALELEEAKLRERHFSYDVFESTLAQTSFLRYKGEEDQVMFQHSKLGIITIESASDWRTALNDSWQHYGDGMIRFSIKSRQAGFSQYPTPEYGLESLGDQDYGLPTLSYCVLMLT